MKWFIKKEMLQDILERNKNELEKYKNDKIVALLKDESNLIQDHLILLDENEKLKTEKQELIECIKSMVFCGVTDKYVLESGMLSNEEWSKMWATVDKYCNNEVLGND